MAYPTLRYRYSDDIGCAQPAILERVSRLFQVSLRYDRQETTRNSARPSTSANVESSARTIHQAILRSAHVRGIPGAVDLNTAVMEGRIAQAIRRHVPIPAQMLWSPKKHWVVGSDSDVDLAELTALDTLLTVHVAVRRIYCPGLVFTLHVEDLEFEFMEGNAPAVAESRSRYIAGLRRVIHVLGLEDVFTLVKTSEMAASQEELRSWASQMADNHVALEAYWYESERKGLAGYEGYASYNALSRLGWRGQIPEEMRNHYLRRLSALQDRPRSERVSMILRNFAGILLHYQKNLLTTPSVVEPVKFSFIPPAPGAPIELLGGRVDLRFVSRRVCSLVGAAGPWSTKGYFRQQNRQIMPTFRGWHSLQQFGPALVDGYLTLTRQDEAVDVRADFLVEDR